MKAFTTIAAAIVLVGCCGCSSIGPVIAGGDGQPTGLPELGRTRGLIVAAVCPDYDDTSPTATINVYGIDPVTWAPRAEATFTLASNVQVAGALGDTIDVDGRTMFCTHSDSSAGSFVDITDRQLFNPQFTRLAVQVDDPGTGQAHVGYLDRAGHVTLLDGGQPAHDYNPVFDPSGQRIWYVNGNDNHVYAQALNGSPPVAEGGDSPAAPASLQTPVLIGRPARAVLLSTLYRYVTVNPAGTIVAIFDDNGLHLWRPGSAAVSDGTDVTTRPVTGSPAGQAGQWAPECYPGPWADDSTLLCANGDNFWTLTVTARGVRAGRLLLPPSAVNNAAPLVAPGGRLILYTSTGWPKTLHELALAPGTQLAKVGQDASWLVRDSDYRVLSWS
jgi:hypothetical protein